jgi:hypothetical protein
MNTFNKRQLIIALWGILFLLSGAVTPVVQADEPPPAIARFRLDDPQN